MAFRLSQKAFSQVLRTQARTIVATSATKTLARSVPAVGCSRVAFAKSFSTSHIVSNEAAKPAAAPAQPVVPGRTLYFGNLPFFTDKDGFIELLGEFGPIENVRWLTTASKAPLVHVTFQNEADAATIVQSSAQEPFHFGGRDLRVEFLRPKVNPDRPQVPPSNRVYFRNFSGNLQELRDWLGEHALYVNHAFFTRDRTTGEALPHGVITFTTVEHATRVCEEFRGKAGPDGRNVFVRFATPAIPKEPRAPKQAEAAPEAEATPEAQA